MSKNLAYQAMVRLRPDQYEALKAMADRDDRSLAYYVRKAVDLYLASPQEAA